MNNINEVKRSLNELNNNLFNVDNSDVDDIVIDIINFAMRISSFDDESFIQYHEKNLCEMIDKAQRLDIQESKLVVDAINDHLLDMIILFD